ncbi:MAG: hypothetical protein D6710_00085 [Nitrospirae bacterium]|nr:MAG: hypothetical protein D6710_00085 [Nitrospirota bacterium]
MTELLGLDLSIASEEVISLLLENPADERVFYEILEANKHRPEVLRLLYDCRRIPEPVMREVASLLSLPVKASTAMVGAEEEIVDAEIEPEKAQEQAKSLLQRIQRLRIGEKIQLALKGGKEIRNILIRDPNKEVVLKVLENPKLTESEVEMVARNPAVPEEALRYIAKKRDWIRRYSVKVALVGNPKTPPGISTTFISHLRMTDLVVLEKNKNIPEVVRNAIKRYIKMKKR